MAIRPDDLGKEIVKHLQTYTKEVEEALEEGKEEITNQGLVALKSSSPIKKGRYARGWRKKRIGKDFVLHNASAAQLTHLLEKGYAKRGGGRVAGRPHIKPVEEMMVEEFEKQVERAIKG